MDKKTKIVGDIKRLLKAQEFTQALIKGLTDAYVSQERSQLRKLPITAPQAQSFEEQQWEQGEFAFRGLQMAGMVPKETTWKQFKGRVQNNRQLKNTLKKMEAGEYSRWVSLKEAELRTLTGNQQIQSARISVNQALEGLEKFPVSNLRYPWDAFVQLGNLIPMGSRVAVQMFKKGTFDPRKLPKETVAEVGASTQGWKSLLQDFKIEPIVATVVGGVLDVFTPDGSNKVLGAIEDFARVGAFGRSIKGSFRFNQALTEAIEIGKLNIDDGEKAIRMKAIFAEALDRTPEIKRYYDKLPQEGKNLVAKVTSSRTPLLAGAQRQIQKIPSERLARFREMALKREIGTKARQNIQGMGIEARGEGRMVVDPLSAHYPTMAPQQLAVEGATYHLVPLFMDAEPEIAALSRQMAKKQGQIPEVLTKWKTKAGEDKFVPHVYLTEKQVSDLKKNTTNGDSWFEALRETLNKHYGGAVERRKVYSDKELKSFFEETVSGIRKVPRGKTTPTPGIPPPNISVPKKPDVFNFPPKPKRKKTPKFREVPYSLTRTKKDLNPQEQMKLIRENFPELFENTEEAIRTHTALLSRHLRYGKNLNQQTQAMNQLNATLTGLGVIEKAPGEVLLKTLSPELGIHSLRAGQQYLEKQLRAQKKIAGKFQGANRPEDFDVFSPKFDPEKIVPGFSQEFQPVMVKPELRGALPVSVPGIGTGKGYFTIPKDIEGWEDAIGNIVRQAPLERIAKGAEETRQAPDVLKGIQQAVSGFVSERTGKGTFSKAAIETMKTLPETARFNILFRDPLRVSRDVFGSAMTAMMGQGISPSRAIKGLTNMFRRESSKPNFALESFLETTTHPMAQGPQALTSMMQASGMVEGPGKTITEMAEETLRRGLSKIPVVGEPAAGLHKKITDQLTGFAQRMEYSWIKEGVEDALHKIARSGTAKDRELAKEILENPNQRNLVSMDMFSRGSQALLLRGLEWVAQNPRLVPEWGRFLSRVGPGPLFVGWPFLQPLTTTKAALSGNPQALLNQGRFGAALQRLRTPSEPAIESGGLSYIYPTEDQPNLPSVGVSPIPFIPAEKRGEGTVGMVSGQSLFPPVMYDRILKGDLSKNAWFNLGRNILEHYSALGTESPLGKLVEYLRQNQRNVIDAAEEGNYKPFVQALTRQGMLYGPSFVNQLMRLDALDPSTRIELGQWLPIPTVRQAKKGGLRQPQDVLLAATGLIPKRATKGQIGAALEGYLRRYDPLRMGPRTYFQTMKFRAEQAGLIPKDKPTFYEDTDIKLNLSLTTPGR